MHSHVDRWRLPFQYRCAPLDPEQIASVKGRGKKELSDIAQAFGPDARRFEWEISGIFTARSNAAAGF
jgi:hypothetical protein